MNWGIVKRTVAYCCKPVDSIPAFTNVRAILRYALNFSVHFDKGKKGNSRIWIVILTRYGPETVSDSGCAPKGKIWIHLEQRKTGPWNQIL